MTSTALARFARGRAPLLAVLPLVLPGPGCAPDGGGSGAPAGSTPGLFGDAAAFAGMDGEPSSGASPAFWEHWGDGRAEMSSYHIVLSRYDEPREGELVLIYVTEPHDRTAWIKDDDATGERRTEVLKLNSSLEFLTGIYPYSVMTSVFSPVDDWDGERFRPTRISFSAQEWCGSYVHQVWPGEGALRSLRLSYFAGQGERMGERDVPAGLLYEDALLIQLRELDGPFEGGGDWEGWIFPSLWNVRRGVAPPEPVEATLRRTEAADSAGRPITRFTLRYDDYTRSYDVEAAHPRRILGWHTSAGDTARLVETRRLPYWELNHADGRRHRSDLGLHPGASGVPPRAVEEPGGGP